ncbi:MAG: hypothetical protein PHX72_00290 [Candidatus Shapirobacteria bacterium]|nr:hypothetical protein [Candidatus Shapirobacteria bacterium]
MKKSLMFVVAGLLVVVAVLLVIVSQRSKIAPLVTNNLIDSDRQQDLFSGTLKAAIAKGIPMKCSYEINGVEYESYVKGKKYRGIISKDGQTQEILMADNYMYTWQEGKTQGLKMFFDLESDEETDETLINPDMEYKCWPAVISDDQFSLPDDIDFVDLDQITSGELSESQLQQLEQMSQTGQEE